MLPELMKFRFNNGGQARISSRLGTGLRNSRRVRKCQSQSLWLRHRTACSAWRNTSSGSRSTRSFACLTSTRIFCNAMQIQCGVHFFILDSIRPRLWPITNLPLSLGGSQDPAEYMDKGILDVAVLYKAYILNPSKHRWARRTPKSLTHGPTA